MSEQKKKNIILITCMIICVIITSLLCTKSLECSSCDAKITGKYYISLTGNPYCKDCGKEYYTGFPGDMDNVTDKVNNTLRNVLLIIEILGFGAALVVMNKGGINEVKKLIPTQQSVAETPIVAKKVPTTKPVVENEPIIKHKPVVENIPDIEPFSESTSSTPTSTTTSSEEPISEVSGRLKTTFKTASKPSTDTDVSSAENFASTSAPEDASDRFKPAGDL